MMDLTDAFVFLDSESEDVEASIPSPSPPFVIPDLVDEYGDVGTSSAAQERLATPHAQILAINNANLFFNRYALIWLYIPCFHHSFLHSYSRMLITLRRQIQTFRVPPLVEGCMPY